jgi:hypothetical protein
MRVMLTDDASRTNTQETQEDVGNAEAKCKHNFEYADQKHDRISRSELSLISQFAITTQLRLLSDSLLKRLVMTASNRDGSLPPSLWGTPSVK